MTPITDEYMRQMLPTVKHYCVVILKSGPNKQMPGRSFPGSSLP